MFNAGLVSLFIAHIARYSWAHFQPWRQLAFKIDVKHKTNLPEFDGVQHENGSSKCHWTLKEIWTAVCLQFALVWRSILLVYRMVPNFPERKLMDSELNIRTICLWCNFADLVVSSHFFWMSDNWSKINARSSVFGTACPTLFNNAVIVSCMPGPND